MPRGDTANRVPRKPQRRPAHQSYAREMGQEMTQAQLYSILMESDTAYKNAEWICAALGVPCPPDRTDDSEIELHEEVEACQ